MRACSSTPGFARPCVPARRDAPRDRSRLRAERRRAAPGRAARSPPRRRAAPSAAVRAGRRATPASCPGYTSCPSPGYCSPPVSELCGGRPRIAVAEIVDAPVEDARGAQRMAEEPGQDALVDERLVERPDGSRGIRHERRVRPDLAARRAHGGQVGRRGRHHRRPECPDVDCGAAGAVVHQRGRGRDRWRAAPPLRRAAPSPRRAGRRRHRGRRRSRRRCSRRAGGRSRACPRRAARRPPTAARRTSTSSRPLRSRTAIRLALSPSGRSAATSPAEHGAGLQPVLEQAERDAWRRGTSQMPKDEPSVGLRRQREAPDPQRDAHRQRPAVRRPQRQYAAVAPRPCGSRHRHVGEQHRVAARPGRSKGCARKRPPGAENGISPSGISTGRIAAGWGRPGTAWSARRARPARGRARHPGCRDDRAAGPASASHRGSHAPRRPPHCDLERLGLARVPPSASWPGQRRGGSVRRGCARASPP